ncbi:MAG: hypothetical protein ACPL4E_01975, partial [Thermoproteota archaeon]
DPRMLAHLIDETKNLKYYNLKPTTKVIGKEGEISLGNRIGEGLYKAKLWLNGESEPVEFTFLVKKAETDKIWVPTNYLGEAVGKEIANLEIYELKLEFYFPIEFVIADKKVTLNLYKNEIRLEEKTIPINEIKNIGCEDGKVYVRVSTGAKNTVGSPLELIFHEKDRDVKIRIDGHTYSIDSIRVNEDGLITIKYAGGVIGKYTIKSGPLSFEKGKMIIELNEKLEGQEHIGLSDRLFEKLGYDALQELKNRIGDDVSNDRRLVVLVNFDNDKVAYCGSKQLSVAVSPGAKDVVSVCIISYEDVLNDYLRMKAFELMKLDLSNPGSKSIIGDVGQLITQKRYEDVILTKVFEVTGIPKDAMELEWMGRKGEEEPDFAIYAKKKIIINGMTIEEKGVIAIGEIKSTTQIEDVENFRGRIEEAEKAFREKYFVKEEYKNTLYGISITLAFEPGLIVEDLPLPAKVGDLDNPFIEVAKKEDIMNKKG